MNRFVVKRVLALLAVLAVTCAMRETKMPKPQVNQPADERAAQARLPQSHDPLWQKFYACKIGYDNRKGFYSIALTPEVRAMAGKTVTLSGFVLPMDGSDRTKHFLLTRRTPVCMFCPPGEPNEVAEVIARHAVNWTDNMVTVTGTLALVNNGEKGIFFKIVATQVK
jgi:hypothetical protein